MRQRHPAGERLFVDYAGHTVDVICPETGEVRTAQIFVAALGASNFTYVEATWTQSLPDWISSHVRTFAFLGGVPAQVVPDNPKAAVIQACFHDPAINRSYGDMAAHCGPCQNVGQSPAFHRPRSHAAQSPVPVGLVAGRYPHPCRPDWAACCDLRDALDGKAPPPRTGLSCLPWSAQTSTQLR